MMLMAIMISSGFAADSAAPMGKLTIELDKPGVKISPMLYGIFFEEINRAGDGGIYAEMIQNRSLEDADSPIAWKSVDANISLDKEKPINKNNLTSLKIEASAGGGVINGGFARNWQERNDPGKIAVTQGKKYELSFYARSQAAGVLTVTIKGVNGKILATQKVNGIGADWKKYTVSLTPIDTDSFARLYITTDKLNTFWLDMVSLFPQSTWKGRKNGLRPDLMEKLVAMKPAFVRFPGGCFVEGIGIENRVQWKNTIGDIAERPGHLNRNWGYFSTDGLGYHEYLQMCEDLNAEPMFVINCGMAHPLEGGPLYAVPMDQMEPYVQDALDAIEYANGPASSKWGAIRAANGHPAPFNLKMIEIGNEETGPDYDPRFALFFDAIKAKYPEMQLIANEPVKSRKPDVIDPHHYGDFGSFLSQINRYDKYNRNDPKIFFGEYAQTEGSGLGNLKAAVAEAAFMTGLERNGDVVTMSSYAPLLCHPDWRGWNPNAVLFDQSQAYGTPSYWNQVLFAHNRSDEVFPVTMNIPPAKVPDIQGKIGVGTWGGQADFKDITVVKNDQLLYRSDFSQGLKGWNPARGKWTTEDGVLRQLSDENGAICTIGDPTWTNYTLKLKARKVKGPEGFLITFGAHNDGDKTWWNLGGWGNRQHGVESAGMATSSVEGKIEADRWYDIRIELRGGQANFYLDDKLVHSIFRAPLNTFTAVAGRDLKTGEMILKFVNASDEPRNINIEIKGNPEQNIKGKITVLTSDNGKDENSFENPTRIIPKEDNFSASTKNFGRTFPPYSITILRWK